jgi:branched-chain amino acid transport system substrate-binding protein
VLGAIASESGPIASTVGQMGPVVTAWSKWINANGGIDGHPVKAIVMDDGGNTTTALSDVKQMVEQDHIIALLPLSGTEAAFGPYTKTANIAAIGGLDEATQYSTQGNWFSLGASPLTNTAGPLKLAAGEGLKKAALMYCAEVAACSEVVAATKTLGGPLGISVVSTSSISSTATDYTAQCLKAKSAGATFLEVSAAATQQLDVGTSCAQQSLKAPLVTGDINFNNSWLKVPAGNGALSVVPSFPFTDTSTPATQTFQAAIKKYDPSLQTSPSWGAAASAAWTSAQLFAAAAKAANMGNSPSTAGIFKGLYALKNETLGGLSTPINYVKGANPNVKNNCGFVMKVQDGKFVEPDGLKPFCVS